MDKKLFSIDLFAGAGGLTEGFHMAGFTPLAANDFAPDAADTFRENFPDVPFLECSVEDLSGNELLEAAGVQAGEVDVLLGGPPCQAFSVYNHQRGFHDERSGLFREYLRIVEAIQPRAVVMENVTGMRSVGDGRAIKEIHDRLGDLGYTVEHRILRAEDFGVPQERRRIFFVACKESDVTWREPTHGDPSDLFSQQLTPFVTVGDAIADLPDLENGGGTTDLVEYTKPATSEYQKLLREGSPGVANHRAPNLGKKNMKRIDIIEPGGSWRDLPQDLLPAGMKRARRSDHTKRYGRLELDGLFSTILTKADMHWGAFIHPTQDRTLTVRECARAQSFPDRFIFCGNRGEQYRQVGNAVPPLLAKAVAISVREMLGEATTSEVASA